MLRPVLRIVMAAGLAVGLASVPVTAVRACSCMDVPLEQAVAEADLAIVGTLAAVEAPPPDEFEVPMVMEWTIERSRDPISVDRATITGWPDSGANCGVSFEVGSRWLVLASLTDGGLETHGCLPNRPLNGDDPESAAIVDAMHSVGPSAAPEETGSPPLPILGGGAALLLLLALSLLAFRRRAPGES